MDTINEHNFLIYLKKEKPYLYKLEMEIRRVRNGKSGYGSVSFDCTIRESKVFSADSGGWIKERYES